MVARSFQNADCTRITPSPEPTNLTDDVRITGMEEVIAPEALIEALPITAAASRTTFTTRQAISDILHGRDPRLMVVIGPCSIHDPAAALEYADRLLELARRHEEHLLIVMRVYFEKPRTTVGWKGLINDPDLDNSFDINTGLRLACCGTSPTAGSAPARSTSTRSRPSTWRTW